jgi:hypothetical protein
MSRATHGTTPAASRNNTYAHPARTTPRKAAEAISRWLREGDAQSASGAYCGWRDLRNGKLSPPYPEITGYVLGFLAQTPLDGADAARATVACAWLTARTEAGDLSARPEKTGRAVYTFDLAMAAHGLMRYGLATGDNAAVDAGLRNAEVLVTQARRDGSLPCVVPGTADVPLTASWSTHGHAHLLKCVQALLSADALGLTAARTVAERMVGDVLNKGEKAVRALTDGCRSGNRTSLHALCYAAEGMWVWGTYHSDAASLSLSRRITEWIWRQRLPGGGFPGFVPIRDHDARTAQQSDVLAQAIRLAALHTLRGPGCEQAAAALLDSLRWQGPVAAVCYRPYTEDLHLNCWASLFAVQALRLCSGDQDTLQWSELV